MATYNSFEDLPVWKTAKELSILAYKTTAEGKLRKDYGLKDQIQRAAVSVSSNITEGFERGSKREFIQFLYIAKGSCGELRSQLYIAKDLGYLDNGVSDNLIKSAYNTSKQISGFIKYLKNSQFPGDKFKT
ncbi:MAG TPA: four helix bundle protein [Phycisphaerales bacterium]|nr:four helix bundle protein [Phycisphaerales bacterium]